MFERTMPLTALPDVRRRADERVPFSRHFSKGLASKMEPLLAERIGENDFKN